MNLSLPTQQLRFQRGWRESHLSCTSTLGDVVNFYNSWRSETRGRLKVAASRQRERNHRTVGVGRGLCGSSSPTLLPKQAHLQQAAQDRVQEGLEYLQRRRIHNLPGQPVPVLRHPQREEVLPPVQAELPVLQFVPIASCPVTGHHWNELGPILLTPTLQIFLSIY